MADPAPKSPLPIGVRNIVSIVRPNRWPWLLVAGLVALALAVVGVILATRNTGTNSSLGSAHLVIIDPAKSTVSVANSSAKQLYKVTYPKYSYPNFEASSPKGEVLLSLSVGSPEEGFLFIKGGKAQTLSADVIKNLRTAIVLNSSQHIFFTDENDAVYVSCPSGASCKLISLDLTSAKTKTVVDTGATPVAAGLAPVYPLGLSANRASIFLRTLTANKLGKDTSAVYQVNLANGKVLNSYPVSRDADYTPALSPDAERIVYKTGDKTATLLHVLNMVTNKSYQAKWTSGEIADSTTALSWSPDSTKVLAWGSDSVLPRPKLDSSFPINAGYLDVPKNTVTGLQTIQDSAHNQIAYQGWLDSSNIVYEQDTSTQAYDFNSPTIQILKYNISAKGSTKLSSLSGNLKQVAYW